MFHEQLQALGIQLDLKQIYLRIRFLDLGAKVE